MADQNDTFLDDVCEYLILDLAVIVEGYAGYYQSWATLRILRDKNSLNMISTSDILDLLHPPFQDQFLMKIPLCHVYSHSLSRQDFDFSIIEYILEKIWTENFDPHSYPTSLYCATGQFENHEQVQNLYKKLYDTDGEDYEDEPYGSVEYGCEDNNLDR